MVLTAGFHCDFRTHIFSTDQVVKCIFVVSQIQAEREGLEETGMDFGRNIARRRSWILAVNNLLYFVMFFTSVLVYLFTTFQTTLTVVISLCRCLGEVHK